ncbi:hypothetical protein A3K64_03600 [Candidatus Micrarchaeota archaeon RBG_16_36_9]|nr:MAG: hypothetical protein A3K64_03600 [Candidatus Micrarchaeota archaeon RBG_16_36_9]
MTNKTVRLIPNPDILSKHKRIVILFFLILGILPILFSYVLFYKDNLNFIINFIISIIWYIIYTIGAFKGIDTLIKGYKVLYFNPKILLMNLIFLVILIIPIFALFFGFSIPLFLNSSSQLQLGIFIVSLLLLVFYVSFLFFAINIVHFLSIYAELLYLFDSFSGKPSSSLHYVMSSLSKIKTGIKFALTKEIISIPGAIIGSRTFSKLVEIATVFSVPLIILEKLTIKEAFEESSKMSSKQIPEIDFVLTGPSLIAIYIILALLLFGSFLIPGFFIEKIMSSSGFSYNMYNYVIIISIFLSYLIPSIIITLYYTGVVSGIQDMSILLLYLKSKGYPVNIEEIRNFKMTNS